MRTLLFLALLALGLYWYAERYGLAVGYPPFLPVFYWNYTGEARYPLRVTGLNDAVKVKVVGNLRGGPAFPGTPKRGPVLGGKGVRG